MNGKLCRSRAINQAMLPDVDFFPVAGFRCLPCPFLPFLLHDFHAGIYRLLLILVIMSKYFPWRRGS